MTSSPRKPKQHVPEDPEAAFPTLPAEAWADFETALRQRSPSDRLPVPSEWAMVVYAGTHLGRVFPLVPGRQVIGRSPQANLSLLDEEVSRQHARLGLEFHGDQAEITLEDLGSTNGTFVNGIPLTGSTRLEAGDRVALGTHVLKLVAMDPLERQFHETLIDKSTRDPLTGLSNRGATLGELQTGFELSHRHSRPMAVIMCDLDCFKQINDKYGHAGGDQVLRTFGERITSKLRGTDIAGRIGGEEFLIILPETDLDGAMQLGERLRATIADEPMVVDGISLMVTCSLGVAERSSEDRDGGALLARADAALYGAKHRGRNRVVSAGMN